MSTKTDIGIGLEEVFVDEEAFLDIDGVCV
jgi:hypothetical protein